MSGCTGLQEGPLARATCAEDATTGGVTGCTTSAEDAALGGVAGRVLSAEDADADEAGRVLGKQGSLAVGATEVA